MMLRSHPRRLGLGSFLWARPPRKIFSLSQSSYEKTPGVAKEERKERKEVRKS
jgi:hypothetical protein